MPTLADIRTQYPQYKDMSDDELETAIYRKFYSDMDRNEFHNRMAAKGVAKEMGSPVADFLKSIPRGIARGFISSSTAVGQAEQTGMGQEPGPSPAALTPEQDKAAPQGRAGKYGEAVGEFLGNPASYIGPGGIVGKVASAVGGGLGSEAAGQAAEGTKAEPYARIVGAVLGGGAPGIVGRAVTPLPTDPRRLAAVGALRAEGVEPTAGQVTGRRALRFAEGALGEAPGAGGAMTATKATIDDQFTRAALARIGETADRATPDVIDRAVTRIGNQFDTLAARNDARIDRLYLTDILQAQQDYNHLFVDPLRKPLVDNVVDHAFNQLQRSQTMTGRQYQALRSRIERMRRSARSDPELGMFLADVRDSMDDLMERNIARNNPADAGAWREVRNQYRNLLVVETAATGAGEAAREGVISPAKLRQATITKQGRREFARGRGDFAELARSGENILQYPQSSGTSERHLALGIPAALGSAAAATFTGGAPFAVPAALAGLAAPGLAGRGLMSRPVQAYLKNQWAAPLLRNLPPWQIRALRSAIVEQTSK